MLITGLHHWFTLNDLGSVRGYRFFEGHDADGLRHSLNFSTNDFGVLFFPYCVT